MQKYTFSQAYKYITFIYKPFETIFNNYTNNDKKLYVHLNSKGNKSKIYSPLILKIVVDFSILWSFPKCDIPNDCSESTSYNTY